jgi:hypothetical protein
MPVLAAYDPDLVRAHPIVGCRWLVSLALAFAAVVSAPGVAQADIFWVSGGATNHIGRASNDGKVLDPQLITGLRYVGGLAAGDGYIYWTSGSHIGRARLNGTGVDRTFISDLGDLNGIAVTKRYIYWLSEHDKACGGGPGFGRATLAATAVDRRFVCGGGRAGAIADAPYANGLGVSGNYIYWSWINGIGRLNTKTRRYDNRFITLPSGYSAAGVTVSDNYMYWGSYTMGPLIGRAKLDGSDINPLFITGLSGDYGFEVAAATRYVYFTNYDGSASTIARATPDGIVNWDFITGLGVVGDLVVAPG